MDQLREPRHLVAPRAKAMWATEYGVAGVVVLAVVVVLVWTGTITGAWRFAACAVGGLLVVAGACVVPFWRYAVHRWEITDTAVYTQRGWLVRERRIAPVSRVQTVDTERGPLAQLFGLTTVTITTASAKGELRIEGLTRNDAEQVVRDLTTTTAANPGDAT
ncbi:PH domain-containing protein [Allobranchiibius sp. CTAmp26]|uniref:PH domain-containing protein n=1 Tax=Allobranchiibius sp. CTAmp26 TaxID=2815214 RepID=UPI0027DE01B4|nr:PH domain-containing protein [Allobranchiibius sp. CTAmp26]